MLLAGRGLHESRLLSEYTLLLSPIPAHYFITSNSAYISQLLEIPGIAPFSIDGRVASLPLEFEHATFQGWGRAIDGLRRRYAERPMHTASYVVQLIA